MAKKQPSPPDEEKNPLERLTHTLSPTGSLQLGLSMDTIENSLNMATETPHL